MSRPELDIIRSPSAETFLRMVTQGFYDRSAMALWIYEVIGREWDELRVIVGGMQAETQPQTCTWSMGIWEWMYGIEPDGELPLEHRRQTLMRQIGGVKPANPAMFRRGLAALLGTGEEDIEIRDFLRPYTFGVFFRPTGTTAFDYERVRAYLDASKPAHLAYQLIFQIAATQAWAYAVYGGQIQKRWAEIVPPPGVRPPEAEVTAIYGGVLAGMAGSAERAVTVPAAVGPPVCEPSLAAAWACHTALRGRSEVEADLHSELPRIEATAVYGGVLASMIGALRPAGTGVELGI